MLRKTIRISEDGRVVIPAEMRRRLGLVPGEPMTLTVEGQEIRLITRRARIKAAQASVARYIPKGVDLVAELIAERRAEARRELEDE